MLSKVRVQIIYPFCESFAAIIVRAVDSKIGLAHRIQYYVVQYQFDWLGGDILQIIEFYILDIIIVVFQSGYIYHCMMPDPCLIAIGQILREWAEIHVIDVYPRDSI